MYIAFFSFSGLLHQFNEIIFIAPPFEQQSVFFAEQLPSVVLLACLFCQHVILSDAAEQQDICL